MIPGQGEISQLMIMLNLFDGVGRPSDIAKNIDITLQGVQYHLKILKGKGLVNDDNTVSQKGFEYLYTGLNRMRSFVSENIFKLDRVMTWEAISSDHIDQGDEVYLKMEGGYLHAFKNKVSGSRGTSVTSGKPGDIIGISGVEGLIDVDLKGISILIIPDVESEEKTASVKRKLKEKILEVNADIIAVIGESAMYIAGEIGIENPVQYAPLEASFEAARRGLSSAVIASNRRFRFMLDDLKSLEKKNDEVKVSIFTI